MSSPAPSGPAQPSPTSGAGSVHVPGEMGRLSVGYGPGGAKKPAKPTAKPKKQPKKQPKAPAKPASRARRQGRA